MEKEIIAAAAEVCQLVTLKLLAIARHCNEMKNFLRCQLSHHRQIEILIYNLCIAETAQSVHTQFSTKLINYAGRVTAAAISFTEILLSCNLFKNVLCHFFLPLFQCRITFSSAESEARKSLHFGSKSRPYQSARYFSPEL